MIVLIMLLLFLIFLWMISGCLIILMILNFGLIDVNGFWKIICIFCCKDFNLLFLNKFNGNLLY